MDFARKLDNLLSTTYPSPVPKEMMKRNTPKQNPWGSSSYADLITKAIENSPNGRLTLSQIYEWIVQNVPHFSDKADGNRSAGWKNSIRHNLSLHTRFIRVRNENSHKSSWWSINPNASGGSSIRRRSKKKPLQKSSPKIDRSLSLTNQSAIIRIGDASNIEYLKSHSNLQKKIEPLKRFLHTTMPPKKSSDFSPMCEISDKQRWESCPSSSSSEDSGDWPPNASGWPMPNPSLPGIMCCSSDRSTSIPSNSIASTPSDVCNSSSSWGSSSPSPCMSENNASDADPYRNPLSFDDSSNITTDINELSIEEKMGYGTEYFLNTNLPSKAQEYKGSFTLDTTTDTFSNTETERHEGIMCRKECMRTVIPSPSQCTNYKYTKGVHVKSVPEHYTENSSSFDCHPHFTNNSAISGEEETLLSSLLADEEESHCSSLIVNTGVSQSNEAFGYRNGDSIYSQNMGERDYNSCLSTSSTTIFMKIARANESSLGSHSPGELRWPYLQTQRTVHTSESVLPLDLLNCNVVSEIHCDMQRVIQQELDVEGNLDFVENFQCNRLDFVNTHLL